MTDHDFHLVRMTGGAHEPGAARERLRQRDVPRSQFDLTESAERFRPGEKLLVAINTALNVGAPLLLTGEPGTGKTQVAYYIGWYFGIEVFPYQVTSQAQAEDLRYEFDAVGYLRTAHDKDETERRKTRDDFLRKRALWRAFEHDEPSVLLIDEIDKAPRDFPNDLLRELDQHSFEHPFTGTPVTYRANRPPITVITSNVERRLPEPFLRRCIFHHIDLTDELLRDAVEAHRKQRFPSLDDAMLAAALRRFGEVRALDGLRKAPSTAELLVWLSVLGLAGESKETIERARISELPGLHALVKDFDDLKRVARA